MPNDRTPVITRTGSVFPKDTSGGNVLLNQDVAAYDKYREDIQRRSDAPVGTAAQLAARDKKKKQDKVDAQQKRVSLAQQEAYGQQVYVDGRLVTIYNLYDKDGKPVQIKTLSGARTDGKKDEISPGMGTLLPGQQAEYDNAQAGRNATYSVLGINDVAEDAAFIMGRGDPVNSQGQTFYDTERGKAVAEDNLVKHRPGTDDQGRPLNRNTTATNMMTVSGGVTWFKQLSQKDPAAYDEMVKLLVDSKYLPKEKARNGVYTLDAGRAFAYAAADAAENASAGGQDDLRSFLGKVATSAGGQDDYQPVNRSYIDPAALAQQARAAAQEALGRALTPEEEAKFTAHFRGLEDNYYNQIDAAGRAKTGAHVADPNASGQVDAYVRSPQFDADRSKQMLGGYMDALTKLVNGA